MTTFSVSQGLRVSHHSGHAERARRAGSPPSRRASSCADRRCWRRRGASGSTTSVRATHETFQMLNWPSASVARCARGVPRPVASGHVIRMREREAGQRRRATSSRGRAMVPDAVAPCRIAVIVAPVAVSRLVALAGCGRGRARGRALVRLASPSAGRCRSARASACCRSIALHLALARAGGRRWRSPSRGRPRAAARRDRASSPLALVLLPWLPFRVPPAFLAVDRARCVAGLDRRARSARRGDRTGARRRSTPPTPTRGGAPRRRRSRRRSSRRPRGARRRRFPGGDEPHYLVITQSLLYDHDLQIENNHRRGDYRAYFAGDLQPDFDPPRPERRRSIRSTRRACRRSSLPAFAIGGYHGVVVFLILRRVGRVRAGVVARRGA